MAALLNRYSISGSTAKCKSFTENSLSSSFSSSGTIPKIGPLQVKFLINNLKTGLSLSFEVSLK